jgi:hypothetical protein
VIFQIRGTNAALEDAFDQIVSEAEEKLDFQVQPFDTIGQRPWGFNPDILAKDE